jgi:hypothetical protein
MSNRTAGAPGTLSGSPRISCRLVALGHESVAGIVALGDAVKSCRAFGPTQRVLGAIPASARRSVSAASPVSVPTNHGAPSAVNDLAIDPVTPDVKVKIQDTLRQWGEEFRRCRGR